MKIKIEASAAGGKIKSWECEFAYLGHEAWTGLQEIALAHKLREDAPLQQHFKGAVPTLAELRDRRPEWFLSEKSGDGSV